MHAHKEDCCISPIKDDQSTLLIAHPPELLIKLIRAQLSHDTPARLHAPGHHTCIGVWDEDETTKMATSSRYRQAEQEELGDGGATRASEE